MSVPHKVASSA